MARKSTKKQPEAPQVNIGAEIFSALRDLEKAKGIPVDYMVERLKQALANAYRKDREDHRDVPGENVVVGLSEDGLTMHQIKTVVDDLWDVALEIHIAAAVIGNNKCTTVCCTLAGKVAAVDGQQRVRICIDHTAIGGFTAVDVALKCAVFIGAVADTQRGIFIQIAKGFGSSCVDAMAVETEIEIRNIVRLCG